MFQAFDEFLHFPYFNIFLSLVGLWGAHCEQRGRVWSPKEQVLSSYGTLFGVFKVLVRECFVVVASLNLDVGFLVDFMTTEGLAVWLGRAENAVFSFED